MSFLIEPTYVGVILRALVRLVATDRESDETRRDEVVVTEYFLERKRTAARIIDLDLLLGVDET